MSSRLGRFCEMIMEAGWLLAVVMVPLFFNLNTATVFEPDKAALLQVIVWIMVLAWAVRFLQRPTAWALGRVGRAIRSGSTTDVVPVEEPEDDYDPPSVIITALDEPLPPDLPSPPLQWPSIWLPNLVEILAVAWGLLLIVATALSVQGWSSLLGSYTRAQGVLALLGYVAVFLLLAGNLRSRAQVERLFLAVTLSSVPVAVYAIVQAAGLDPLPWGAPSGTVASTLGNASFLAGYLVLALPMSLTGLLLILAPLRGSLRRDTPRGLGVLVPIVGNLALLVAVYLPTLLVQLAALVLTNAWYAVLGAVLAVLLLALFVLAVALLSLSSRLIQTAGVVAVLVGAVALALALTGAVALALTDMTPAQAISLDSLGTVRALIWPGARAVVTDWPSPNPDGDLWAPLRPAVGYGPETFAYAFNQVYPLDLMQSAEGGGLVDRPYNTLLLVTGELGYIGLALHLALMAVAFLGGLFAVVRGRSVYHRLALAGAMAALLAWLVYAQFYPVPTAGWLFFWVLLGVLVAVGRQARERPKEGQAYRGQALADPQRAYALLTGLMLLGATGTVFYLANFAFTRWESLPTELAILAGPWAVLAIVVGLANWGVGVWWRRRLSAPADSAAADVEAESRRRDRVIEVTRLGWTILFLLVAVAAVLVSLGLILVAVNNMGTLVEVNAQATPELVVLLVLVAVALGVVGVALSLKRAAVPFKPFTWSGLIAFGLVVLGAGIIKLLLIGVVFLTVYQPMQADILTKQAQATEQAGQGDRSIALYQQVIALTPNRDWTYTFLARAHVQVAQAISASAQRDAQMEQGIAALEQGRALNPLNPDHSAELARAYVTWAGMAESAAVQDTRIEKAGAYYEAAVRLTPHNIKLLREMADMYFKHSRLAEAARGYERIVTLAPDDAAAWGYLGLIYSQQKKTDQAIAAFEKLITLVPDRYEPYLELAKLYQGMGNQAKALDMAQKALQRAPDTAKPVIQQLINELEQ
ncbi:MAG: tetratricopeptide repeat protein [Chloroflexi bacterium]|nr:tetratricopeptide repeat protein [Chloroflexota bacterium]MBU1747961.1 tetratricopeptide repeat protein [Chloroflexota bacterium]